MKLQIVSIVYHEREWQQTKACIEESGFPVIYVERSPKGVGNLAEAINRGFKETNSEYVLIVTNATFSPSLPANLVKLMDKTEAAAIHPCFDSDHQHLRQVITFNPKDNLVSRVPFVEFTCPIVRSDVFREFPLDEKMPYVHHDIDWGYRVMKAGHSIGVSHLEKIGHTYIRFKAQLDPMTRKRRQMRALAEPASMRTLKEKYIKSWSGVKWMEHGNKLYESIIRTQFK